MNNNSLFDDFRIESASRNEIYLEVQVEFLVRALRSAQSAAETVMRLTKKDGSPVLSFGITIFNRGGKPLDLVQDVPVRVMSPQQMAEVREPLCPEPDVHIMMPPLLNVRIIVERMKTMADNLIVAANMSGELLFKVETPSVRVETRFAGLTNPPLDVPPEELPRRASSLRDPRLFAEARVDLRSFAKFLHSHHVLPTNVVCCVRWDAGRRSGGRGTDVLHSSEEGVMEKSGRYP
ncbi:MAG: checkpoint protein Hus1/Mec3 [Olpidium bornovanus]|uniref:Checkpoint protein n=1 Tax=Olpidium bornovanus TaxID=278681 RepID=A0A8H8DMF3_9FUNG|nr:MAG: checkpoint protein Hus1/Mec3 [Olpidium bornovanus]